MDAAALHAAQAARWRAVDPLLPPPPPPEPGPLSVTDGAGWTRTTTLDPASRSATWTALRQHNLTALVAGPDPAVAMAALLDRWDHELRAATVPDDDDSAAEVIWPSRDTSPVLALLRRGFAPVVATAARRTGGAAANAVAGVTIRAMRASDVEAGAELVMHIVRYDAQFGSVTERSSSLDRLAEGLARLVGRDPASAWVAVRHGRPVGLCTVETPADTGWVGDRCATGPVGCVAELVVAPDERGGGIGAALHAHADAALQAVGTAVTLLQHAVPNPLSTPFWYRQGYRPLWTQWQRRPAVRG